LEIDCFERRIGLPMSRTNMLTKPLAVGIMLSNGLASGVGFPSFGSSRTQPDAASVPIRIASANVPSSLTQPAIAKNNFEFILLNDFTCRETRLHNADWFNRMITLGSIQRYAV